MKRAGGGEGPCFMLDIIVLGAGKECRRNWRSRLPGHAIVTCCGRRVQLWGSQGSSFHGHGTRSTRR